VGEVGVIKDVLVIGGGPAGLAVAIAKGLNVTVVDAACPPIDKACGEAILPAGVEALGQLGVRLSTADGFPIHGIRFLGDGMCVEASFPSGDGLALRRTALHELLAFSLLRNVEVFARVKELTQELSAGLVEAESPPFLPRSTKGPCDC
jgi:2-polyprenyl-6-methoxyphenol hydroxylase-like FAD-dependent oxidoreductase